MHTGSGMDPRSGRGSRLKDGSRLKVGSTFRDGSRLRDGPGCCGHFPSPSPGNSPTALLVLRPLSKKKRFFPPAPGLGEFESRVSALERQGDIQHPPGMTRSHHHHHPVQDPALLENIWAGEKNHQAPRPGCCQGGEGPTCQGSATGGDVFVEINHRGEQCGRAGSGLRTAPSRRLNIYLSRSCLPVMDRRFQGGARFCSSTEPGPARCPAGDGATNHAGPWGHWLRLP